MATFIRVVKKKRVGYYEIDQSREMRVYGEEVAGVFTVSTSNVCLHLLCSCFYNVQRAASKTEREDLFMSAGYRAGGILNTP